MCEINGFKVNPAAVAHLAKLDQNMLSKLDPATINQLLKMDIQTLSTLDNTTLAQVKLVHSLLLMYLIIVVHYFYQLRKC